MSFRTDENNNPAAFDTSVASEAGLVLGTEYTMGTQFPNGVELWTARLIGDPILLTIRVIDKLTFRTHTDSPRWSYIDLPPEVWSVLTVEQKRDVIGFMYAWEGGVTMRPLFPNYRAPWLPLPVGWWKRF